MQILQDLLNDAGLNKSQLAKLMGCSRSKIMRYGDHVTDQVRHVVADYSGKPVDTDAETVPLPADLHVDIHARKEPDTYSDDDIRVLLKRRGTGEADYDIAHDVGLLVWEFNKLIHDHAVAGCIKRIGRCHTG